MRPLHLTTASGQRFCVVYEPSRNHSELPVGSVLLAPPLAEELNRSRRQLSLMSRALAQAGVLVLNIDLKGTGDSPGNFSDATWKDWIDDLEQAWRWLELRAGVRPMIWGVRGGCWLGMDLARRLGVPMRMVFWQPQQFGSMHVNQWLRQKTMGEMLQGQTKTDANQLRSQWSIGDSVEIGGYEINANIAESLQAADLGDVVPSVEIQGFECSSQGVDELSAGSIALQQLWQSNAVMHRWQLIKGEAYWQLAESPDQTELVAATLAGVLQALR